MLKKIIPYIALIFVAGSFLMAARCGNGTSTSTIDDPNPSITSEPITLEYWRLWDESSVLDEFIKEYNETYPNITIEVKKIEIEDGETIYDYQSRIIKLIADGGGPDMFMIHNDWLDYMKNQITPVPTGMITTQNFQEVFPDVVEDDFISDDRIYAVPYSIDNLVLFYNTNILEANNIKQLPSTLVDLAGLVQNLTKYNPDGSIRQSALPLGVSDGIPRAADILATLMMQYGAEMTSEDNTTATFNLPASNTNPPVFSAQEALAYYTQFADPNSDYYTYTDARDSDGNRVIASDVQAFMEGKAAMMLGYSYQVNRIRQFNPNLKFDTTGFPQLQLQDRVVMANYWGETVSRTSEHPTEAWDFIRFVAQKSNQAALFTITGKVPAREDLLETYTDRRYFGAVARQVPYSKSWYRNNTPEVETIFAEMINNVLHNKITPEIAIDTAVRDINDLD